MPDTPAAFTRIVGAPTSLTAAATAAVMAASSRTSRDQNPARGLSSAGSWRSKPATVAPSPTKRCAHAAPMPEAAPVT